MMPALGESLPVTNNFITICGMWLRLWWCCDCGGGVVAFVVVAFMVVVWLRLWWWCGCV